MPHLSVCSVCGSVPTGSSVSSEGDTSLLSEVFLNQLDDAEAQRNMSKKPRLQPKETTPQIETYTREEGGRVCVMAKLGVEFVVKEDKVGLTKSQHFFSVYLHIGVKTQFGSSHSKCYEKHPTCHTHEHQLKQHS